MLDNLFNMASRSLTTPRRNPCLDQWKQKADNTKQSIQQVSAESKRYYRDKKNLNIG